MSQVDEIETLQQFNRKVEKLERGGFAKRFAEKDIEIIMEFDGPMKFEKTGDHEFNLLGKIKSSMPEFDEEEIEALALTARIFMQNNDRLSVGNIAKIYDQEWMPTEARQRFAEGRQYLNGYLGSAATIEFGE